jgi:hypothetical protein
VAGSAGVVNDRGRDDDAAFNSMLGASSQRVRELAGAVRDLVYDVLPETVEVVWPHQRTVGFGTGPKKMSEHFAYLLPYDDHVTFGFYYGAELPDPAGLLTGSGKLMRSTRIASLEDVTRPALRDLVRASTRHRVPPVAARSTT